MPNEFTEAEKQLLRDTASRDRGVAEASLEQVAAALELPLRQGTLPGDIVTDIFETVSVENGRSSVEFPLHFMQPGTEGQYVGFTVPRYGSIPQRLISGDYVNVPIIDIAGMIDWDNRYAKDARWDVASDAAENVRRQIVKKRNDLGWHSIISAAYDRGAVVADTDALKGQFTTRLVSLAKLIMRRNGGGNSSSINRSKLTDLFISPDASEDMRSWNVDVVDEITRREIFTAQDGMLNRIFGVNLHDIDELGEGQEYQLFYQNVLGGTMPTTNGHTDSEIAVGLDLSSNKSFVRPVAEDITLIPDNTRVRHRQTGLLGFASEGYAVLDQRSTLLLSL